jgi:hypothetical protein
LLVDVFARPIKLIDHGFAQFIERNRAKVCEVCIAVVLAKNSEGVVNNTRFTSDFPILLVVLLGVVPVDKDQFGQGDWGTTSASREALPL